MAGKKLGEGDFLATAVTLGEVRQGEGATTDKVAAHAVVIIIIVVVIVLGFIIIIIIICITIMLAVIITFFFFFLLVFLVQGHHAQVQRDVPALPAETPPRGGGDARDRPIHILYMYHIYIYIYR